MFSCSCFLRWRSRLVCWPKQRLHRWHLKGFSLLWMLRTWRWRLDEMLNERSQYLHLSKENRKLWIWVKTEPEWYSIVSRDGPITTDERRVHGEFILLLRRARNSLRLIFFLLRKKNYFYDLLNWCNLLDWHRCLILIQQIASKLSLCLK